MRSGTGHGGVEGDPVAVALDLVPRVPEPAGVAGALLGVVDDGGGGRHEQLAHEVAVHGRQPDEAHVGDGGLGRRRHGVQGSVRHLAPGDERIAVGVPQRDLVGEIREVRSPPGTPGERHVDGPGRAAAVRLQQHGRRQPLGPGGEDDVLERRAESDVQLTEERVEGTRGP